MKKKTYRILSSIPITGAIITAICDPMLGSSPTLQDGLPTQVCDYAKAHPDTFITKRLLNKIMRGINK